MCRQCSLPGRARHRPMPSELVCRPLLPLRLSWARQRHASQPSRAPRAGRRLVRSRPGLPRPMALPREAMASSRLSYSPAGPERAHHAWTDVDTQYTGAAHSQRKTYLAMAGAEVKDDIAGLNASHPDHRSRHGCQVRGSVLVPVGNPAGPHATLAPHRRSPREIRQPDRGPPAMWCGVAGFVFRRHSCRVRFPRSRSRTKAIQIWLEFGLELVKISAVMKYS